jgi:hypothetical protein
LLLFLYALKKKIGQWEYPPANSWRRRCVKAIGVLELRKHIVGRKNLCAAMYEIKANTRRLGTIQESKISMESPPPPLSWERVIRGLGFAAISETCSNRPSKGNAASNAKTDARAGRVEVAADVDVIATDALLRHGGASSCFGLMVWAVAGCS